MITIPHRNTDQPVKRQRGEASFINGLNDALFWLGYVVIVAAAAKILLMK